MIVERSTSQPLRGTQSMVHIMGACFRDPRLLGVELAWRWLYGLPALAILAVQLFGLIRRSQLPVSGLSGLSLADPNAAAASLANFSAAVMPPVERLALWLGPILAIGWAFASGIGRSILLRRMVPAEVRGQQNDPGPLIGLQLLRIAALAGTTLFWFRALHWVARATLEPGAPRADFSPNLVGYFAWVIGLSLAMFSVWAMVSWVFSIAPLVSVLERRGMWDSLRHSIRLGPLTPKLVEVNFVLGIVKMALVVLAMVFCATPLPFESLANGNAIYAYWGFVTLLYMAASDFFQVVRLAAFIEFWKVLKGTRR